MNILLIEGNAAVRDALVMLLEDMGHTVHCVSSVDTGLAYLHNTTSSHVVIVSNQTPFNRSLTSFFQRVNDDPTLRDAHRYVALTTAPGTLPPQTHAALQSLHAALIYKPFDLEDLLATLAV